MKHPLPPFPASRPRRLRRDAFTRALVREHRLDASDLIGKAVKRPIRAGDVIAAADVEPPRMVVRGDSVTLMFNKPGLTLSARGKAMSDGAEGSVVSVLNEQSKRTIQGVVTAAGTVAVTASSDPAVVRTAMN